MGGDATIHGVKRLFTQMDTQNVTSIEIGRTNERAQSSVISVGEKAHFLPLDSFADVIVPVPSSRTQYHPSHQIDENLVAWVA